MIKVIVGLGNPGERYKTTRHNFGFLLLDQFAGSGFKPEKKFKAELCRTEKHGISLVCIKPQTFMNLSGESLQSLNSFYQFLPEETLVVHDDLDIPFGQLRLKFGGGEGGHNGLKSISSHLQTREYYRLKLGVGKPLGPNLIATEDWVLQRFPNEEKEKLPEVLQSAEKAIELLIKEGFAKAQSLVNARNLQTAPPAEEA